jgi:hypothetical protein
MGSATMVMPSVSIVAAFRPHIGSEVGGGTRFGAMPESQWPALPAQHGIVSDDAFAIGKSGAINDRATKRHRKHNIARWSCVCFMNFFGAISIYLLAWRYTLGLGGAGFLTSFILHFGQLPGDLEATSSCMGQT